MSEICLRSNKRSINGEEPTECIINMPVQQFMLGDIVWHRINGSTWWPVQVVDEKCVASKPKKKKKEQILVRQYGTFEHMYVEPANCISKTEKICGQENSSNREMFEKALEEDLSRMKSGGQSETIESNENVKGKVEAPGGKAERKGKSKRTLIEENSPNKCSIPEENEELSPRRTRIMQNLGLVAPSGSPFRRNGSVES